MCEIVCETLCVACVDSYAGKGQGFWMTSLGLDGWIAVRDEMQNRRSSRNVFLGCFRHSYEQHKHSAPVKAYVPRITTFCQWEPRFVVFRVWIKNPPSLKTRFLSKMPCQNLLSETLLAWKELRNKQFRFWSSGTISGKL